MRTISKIEQNIVQGGGILGTAHHVIGIIELYNYIYSWIDTGCDGTESNDYFRLHLCRLGGYISSTVKVAAESITQEGQGQ